MRYALVSALALCALAAQAVPQKTAQRKIPCKTPENVASCYWTRGRLAFYNGNPPYRLWKIGTKRVLGIFSGPSIWPPTINGTSSILSFRRTSKDFSGPRIIVSSPILRCALSNACIESKSGAIHNHMSNFLARGVNRLI